MKRLILSIIALGALALAGAETVVRVKHAADVPLYRVDHDLGYVPQPNQSGRFLGRYDWTFNNLSMGAGPFTGRGDLLIGDSLVYGEARMTQAQRLGPLMAERLGVPVWPISAQSWALINELTYLRLHPDVVQRVDKIIFVNNSGDFTTPSVWASEITHPTHRPFWATGYAFERGPLKRMLVKPPNPPEGPWQEALSAFHPGKPVTFVLYTQRGEDPAVMKGRQAQIAAVMPSAKFIQIQLPAGDFIDQIHPTPNGTVEMADRIVAAKP
jgi:hypothetical protein